MQIALTKKLASAMKKKTVSSGCDVNSIFSWTANWTNTFDGRKEDMIVMVNNVTRFTVLIYGIKWNQFKDIENKMINAIRNTLLAMNLNAEVVDEYMQKAGELEFYSNSDRKLTAWINHQGLDAAFAAGRAENESYGKMKFNDTLGHIVSRRPVNYSFKYEDSFIPADEMVKTLSELSGKPAYKYRAFEIFVTLDLETYKAIRRMIVPANIKFAELHKLMQNVFDWKNCHLHDFKIIDDKTGETVERIVMSEEDLFYDEEAVLEEERELSEYFPKYKHMIYTYDFGDNWEHTIEFVKVIEEHNEESPYLLEATGQTPPEDVGGVDGFIEFREVMLDQNHPDHAASKSWAGYWSPELSEWRTQPRRVYLYI